MVQAQCSRCNSPEAQWSRCNGVRRATALQGLLEGSWSPAKARPRNARPRSATAPAGQAIGFAKSKARGLCANHCGRSTRAVSDFPTASWLTSRGGPGGVRDDQTHDLDGTHRYAQTRNAATKTRLHTRTYTHTYKETHLCELRHTKARRAFRYTSLVHTSRRNTCSKVQASGSRGGRPCSWHMQKRQRLLHKHDTFHAGDVGSNVEWASTQIRNARYKTHY